MDMKFFRSILGNTRWDRNKIIRKAGIQNLLTELGEK
jgi:hypothetical protein